MHLTSSEKKKNREKKKKRKKKEKEKRIDYAARFVQCRCGSVDRSK